MNSPFIHILSEAAKNQPDKTAIVQGTSKISFQELKLQVEQYSSFLEKKGIGEHDRILIYVPMGTILYVILLAVWRRGATAGFVDAWTSKNRLDHVAKLTKCKAFIGIPKAHILRLFSPALRSISKKIWVLPFNRFKSGYSINPPVSVNNNDTALVTFTTGSTGIPKGANRTFEFLLAQNNSLKEHLKLESTDVDLTTLPVFVLNNLALGVTSVLAPFNPAKPETADPAILIEAINKNEVTCSAGSPIIYELLADYCLSTKTTPAGMGKIFIGGAPVFPKLAQKLNRAFPECAVEIVYGSTEAEPISAVDGKALIDNENGLKKGLLVGKPVDQISLVILKMVNESLFELDEEQFNALCLGPGEVGEICVTGEHVLKQYFQNKDAEKKTKINLSGVIWHRTGDAGYLNESGNLFLMGRVDARIQAGGKTFFVFPLENALCEIEGVKRGTVIEINDDIIAVIDLNKQDSEIKEKVRSMVSKFPVPQPLKVVFQSIPRDPRHNSKIDYQRLKNDLKK